MRRIVAPTWVGVLIVAGVCRAADPPAERGGRVSAEGLTRRTIYHSPQTPGYTCWVGAWAMPDGSLMTCCTQATGPLEGRPRASNEVLDKLGRMPVKDPAGYDFTGLDLHNVYLRSEDLGETWKQVSADSFHTPAGQMSQGGGQVALRDGTILRAVFGFHLPLNPELPKTGYLQRSTDGTKTWGKPEVLLDPARHTYRITRMRFLRDGRLIATGGLARGIPAGARDSMGYVDAWEPLLLVSSDRGTTWTPPLDVVPPEHRKGWSGEEWDTAELPDGDLVCVFRRHDTQDGGRRQVRWQGLLEKQGTGWAMKRLGPSPLPHSGHPDLLMTREGVVLHTATTGVHWTDDGGLAWHPLEFPGLSKPYRSGYYPHALQLADGRIRVFAHRGAHDPYGREQEVLMDTFRLMSNPGI